MVKLENIVKKARNTILLAGALTLGTVMGYAQNTVSGNIRSVPGNVTPAQARITLTNTSNGNIYSDLTTDGNFSMNVPNGTYAKKIEVPGNYQSLENITINSNQTINEQVIDSDPITSTVYGPSGQNRSLLYFMKLLTSTDGITGTTLNHVVNFNPWRIYARNFSSTDPNSMPAELRDEFDAALLEITTKVPEITWNEQFTEDLNNGITSIYVNEVPSGGGFAHAIPDFNNTYVYFDRDDLPNSGVAKNVYLREFFCRATGLSSMSTDTGMTTYYQGYGSGVLHSDEVNVLRRSLSLPNGTNMAKHQDIVIASVPNTIFSSYSITAPTNGSTIAYDGNNQITINTASNAPRDADGDVLTKHVHVGGNGVNINFDVANDAVTKINKSQLKGHRTYTIDAYVTDGVLTRNATNTTFTTPNTPPQAISTTAPANGATVVYDGSNRFEVLTTPTGATDVDDDALTKTIEVWNGPTLVTSQTLANTAQAFVLKSQLQPHTTYTLKVRSGDGIENSVFNSTTFSTPNTLPPTQNITSPSNNWVVVYDANNRFEVVTTPNSAQDADGDNLVKKIEVYKGANLVASKSVANNSQVYILKSELQPHTAYTIKTTLTDGIATTAEKIVNIITPNFLPVQGITSPSNITVTYDANNKFEVTTTPNSAQDTDGDNLTKIIEIYEGANLVKSFNVANNNQVLVSKSDLKGHTDYTLKAKLNDGVETTPYVSTTFSTPNFIPTQSITYPLNNQTVEYVDNKLEILTNPSTAKDEDNDDLYKTIRVFGSGLDTTITKPNTTSIYIPSKRLQQEQTYTIEATLTDGIATTPKTTSTFQTPKIVVGIEDEKFDGLKVYPNPFNNYLNVEYNKNLDMRILDVQGKEVYRQNINGTDTVTPEIAPGMYILQLFNGKDKYTQKIIKN